MPLSSITAEEDLSFPRLPSWSLGYSGGPLGKHYQKINSAKYINQLGQFHRSQLIQRLYFEQETLLEISPQHTFICYGNTGIAGFLLTVPAVNLQHGYQAGCA